MVIDPITFSKITWLVFMTGDLPRLLFRMRGCSKHRMFSTAHRIGNYSKFRIISQQLVQNAAYLAVIFSLYLFYHDLGFLILFLLTVILNGCRIKYQISIGTPYVITDTGHFINDAIMKPFRLVVVLFIFFKLKQFAWLLGFSILFSKWLLITCYDREFDVPKLFHAVLVVSSVILVLSIYPIQVLGTGSVSADALRSVFSTIPAVYTAFVGFLGVLYTIILTENKDDDTLRQYVTKGILLNFSFTSLLTIFSLVAILIFSSQSLSLDAEALFKTELPLTRKDIVPKLFFSFILSLGWFVLLFISMTTYVMFRYTGSYSNQLNPASPLIAKILAMNLEGISIYNIAEQLNKDGVPSLSGGGMWKKENVREIIRSNSNRLSGKSAH
jgi:hypothetical protein